MNIAFHHVVVKKALSGLVQAALQALLFKTERGMKKLLILFVSAAIVTGITACTTAKQFPINDDLSADTASRTEAENENTDTTEYATAMKMNVQIGDRIFTATLEDNAAVRELTELMKQAPISISMSDYSDFEKVGALGRSLTTENHQITTSAGDIVLYNGNQIVIFYGSNSWSYTRIGRIDDLSGWTDALGSGDVTAVFSIA